MIISQLNVVSVDRVTEQLKAQRTMGSFITKSRYRHNISFRVKFCLCRLGSEASYGFVYKKV